MPTSYLDFKKEIKDYIYRRYNKDIKILDVGPGEGTYYNLLPDYKNMDCVEIYEPYVNQFNLKEKYKNVFVSNILDFDFEYYDVIIMGDILEHIETEKAVELINKLIKKCDDIIISVPYLADFNYLYDDEPNKNELYLQVDLTEDVMGKRYTMLKRLWSNDRIGVFVKEKYKRKTKKDLAISVYVDDNKDTIQEFDWLYKSFIFSGNYTNSDIVAFCNPNVIEKINPIIRNDENVVIIPLKPLSDISEKWVNYKFINSIEYFSNQEIDILLNYEYTLSTDCDVFLTSNLKTLRPNRHIFGLGAYINDIHTRDRIVEIIDKLELKYNYLHNIGASYLYKSKNVIDFRILQYKICEYLINNEFNDSYGKWGTWYVGTLTMYAGEIVANQLGYDNIKTNILDSYSMGKQKINNDTYHIHAWHTPQYFSKNYFRKGAYNDIDLDTLNIEEVCDYCLYLASKSIDDILEISKYKKN